MLKKIKKIFNRKNDLIAKLEKDILVLNDKLNAQTELVNELSTTLIEVVESVGKLQTTVIEKKASDEKAKKLKWLRGYPDETGKE
jgi:uncharacterized coiled-coil protein SlyX